MDENLIASKHLTWIDATKGLAVLLVMWGHVTKVGTLTIWIQTFYVPVFFVITGYLFKEHGTNISVQYIKKLSKNILLPYLICGLIAIIPNVVIWQYQGVLSFETVSLSLYQVVVGFGGPLVLWFLPSYYLATICYLWIKRVVITNKIYVYLAVSLLSIVAAVLFQIVVHQYNLQENKLMFYPLCSLIRAFSGIYYICLGASIHSAINQLSKYNCIILSIANFVVSFVLAAVNGQTNYSFLEQGKYPVLLFLCGSLGSIALVLLFKGIYSFGFSSSFVEKCGKYSLELLSTHDTWKVLTLSVGVLHLLWRPEKPPMLYLFGLAVLGIMLLLEVPIVIVLNKYVFKLIKDRL